MELNLLYVHALSMGYGRYGTMLAAEFGKMGIEVNDDLPSPPGQKHSSRIPLENAKSKICNVVCWVSTPSHSKGYWEGQFPVMSTMWEASKLPESFRESVHEFALIIVPSPHNVELFSQFHDNVKLVPLGVDPERWHYEQRRPPRRFFNFLIGGSGPRKGVDLAYQAFRKLWPKEDSWGSGPIPQLIMKSPRGEEHYGPRVQIVGGRISAEDEVELYADAHCYLQPSRGEGFGLQPLQAMAQGCPTVLTDAHGHGSFAHLGWGLGSKMVPAQYFIYGDAGEWWEPSLDDLCDHMQWIYDNYDAACERASESATVVAKEFTWRRTAERFVDAVGRERLGVPYSGSGKWHDLDRKKYLVITNADFVANSVGSTYFFKKGEEYWETADVKRVLFEADKLDLACVGIIGPNGETDMDTGLAPEQLEKLGKTSASQNFCPTCGQGLNTKPTRADVLFDEYQRAAGVE